MAGTVQQRVLVPTMRTRDGSRRNKPRKAWCRRSRGTKGLINALRVFVVGTLNILHNHLYSHFVASFRLLQSPCHVLQCSTDVAHIIFALQKTPKQATICVSQRFPFVSNLLRMRTHISNKFLSFLPLLTLLQACL